MPGNPGIFILHQISFTPLSVAAAAFVIFVCCRQDIFGLRKFYQPAAHFFTFTVTLLVSLLP